MKMKTKQNKIGTYLAVTAGIGCAASMAEGAIQVVDLSGLSTSVSNTPKTFPASSGDSDPDLVFSTNTVYGVMRSGYGGSSFYADGAGILNVASFGTGYTAGPASFPSDPDLITVWRRFGVTAGGGFGVGNNWVAFKDSANNYGWLSFSLSSVGINNTSPVMSFNSFVFDDSSTGVGNAITLETAIDESSSVPEPSSLALLALGSAGLIARRRRKAA